MALAPVAMRYWPCMVKPRQVLPHCRVSFVMFERRVPERTEKFFIELWRQCLVTRVPSLIELLQDNCARVATSCTRVALVASSSLGLQDNERRQRHCGSHEALWVQEQQDQQESHHC